MSHLIDMHVHAIGNNSAGCSIKLNRKMKFIARSMLRSLNIPFTALEEDFTQIYQTRLLELVRESALDAIVLLAHEHTYSEDGEQLDSPMHVPNEYVLNFAWQNKEILAGVSIHPARKDAIEELENCIDKGAALMKCLPMCQNINCNDSRYKPFWELMAEEGLPLLAHTGGEGILPVSNSKYSSPEILRLPLECGVTVIAAHMGTNCGPFDRNYLPLLRKMMLEFPNLYADVSALNTPFRTRYISRCMDKDLIKRLLHGSDYPVPPYGIFPFLMGYMKLDDYLYARSEGNPLERDYQIKKAVGFPEETFTRVFDLFPWRAQRQLTRDD